MILIAVNNAIFWTILTIQENGKDADIDNRIVIFTA